MEEAGDFSLDGSQPDDISATDAAMALLKKVAGLRRKICKQIEMENA